MLQADLIIFDLDGTLIHSIPDIRHAINLMLADLGLTSISEKSATKYLGEGRRKLVERSIAESLNRPFGECGLSPEDLDKAILIYEEYYRSNLVRETKAYPGVEKVLRHFQNLPKVVLSNKSSEFSNGVLAGLGLDSYFEGIFGGDSFPVLKPRPDGVINIMEAHGITAQRTVLVGDTEIDMNTAKNAGVQLVAVTYGYGYTRGQQVLDDAGREIVPDAVVDSFSELVNVIRM